MLPKNWSEVMIEDGHINLKAILGIPEGSERLVLFAHGSGSSRLSHRNQAVAKYLWDRGIGILLLDLLTDEEEQSDLQSGLLRFDIKFLARRLIAATNWVQYTLGKKQLGLGFFGASTGAAAALMAAALLPGKIQAVVSRGGRPDLAHRYLDMVDAPTLLIVGSLDQEVLALNQQALQELVRAQKQLAIVPGASHLFEEAGTLDQVAELAEHWFRLHLHQMPLKTLERKLEEPKGFEI